MSDDFPHPNKQQNKKQKKQIVLANCLMLKSTLYK
jgi:hypothetical protein